MSIPDETWIRDRFADLRRLCLQTETRKGPDGERIAYCPWEEQTIELFKRERRVPTDMTRPDGYPTSTGGGIPSGNDPERLTSVEAAANTNLFAEDATARYLDDQLSRTVTALITHLDQAGRAATHARTSIITGNRTAEHRRSIGQTAAVCSAVGGHEGAPEHACTNPVHAKGLCNTHYQALLRLNTRRPIDDQLTNLPRKVVDDMAQRRTHETGPLAGDAA